MTARPWNIDVSAANRADAIDQICSAGLPHLAERHLVDLVASQRGYYMLWPDPDPALRVWGSGEDHGSYISLERAGLAYG